MSVRLKLLSPIALCSLLLAAYLALGWSPAALPTGERLTVLEVVGAGLLAIIIVAGLAIELVVRRPLVDIARIAGLAPRMASASQSREDEIALARNSVSALSDTISRQRSELQDAIAARKQTEAALHESEERYVLAVRSANDGLWEWNLKSGETYLSARWTSMLGFANRELENTIAAWKGRIHPDDLGEVEAVLDAHLEGRAPRFESEHRLFAKDGSVHWVLSRATAIRHASGKAYRLVGLDSNITRFKHLQQVLRHVAEGTAGDTGEEFFRSLVRHFAEVLGVRVAFVTECVNFPTTRVRALAFWDRGSFVDGVEYDLAGTPCDKVISEGVSCFYPKDLVSLFPKEAGLGLSSYFGIPIFDTHGKVIGHLAFLDEREMDEGMLLTSIYRIFAARAAAELERTRLQKTVLELAQALSAVRGQDCFRALVQNFATVLGVREAFVCECCDFPPTRVRMLAHWSRGGFVANEEFELAGSVCEGVYEQRRMCYYPKDLGDRFPVQSRQFNIESYLGMPIFDSAGGIIGHIVCMHDQAMRNELPHQAILKLFAERASVELERRLLAEQRSDVRML